MSAAPESHDERLCQAFQDKINRLAIKAVLGIDVKNRVRKVVEDAAHQFANLKTSSELANLRAFATSLSLAANLSTVPAHTTTFAYASDLVRDKIRERERGRRPGHERGSTRPDI